MPTAKTAASLYLEELLGSLGLTWTAEVQFHPLRKWRFDYVIENQPKTAIEIEGGTWGKSRHTTGRGYRGDLVKYNRATLLGWTLLRYTPDQLLSGATEADLRELYKQE